MANSIVFQNEASQLKSAVYGYNNATKTYQPIQVNDNGELIVNIATINYVGTLSYIGTLGTLNKVVSVGTLGYLGTLNKVTRVGTLGYLGTLNKVASVGTLGYLGTLNKVTRVGTLGYLGTLNKVASIGTLGYLGTLNKVTRVGTLGYLGTLNKVTRVGTLGYVGTLKSVVGTVKVNLVERAFFSSTQTIHVTKGTPTYSTLIDISKYQDTSWYITNITSANKAAVTVQLAVTPSQNITTYPRVLVSQTTTVNSEAKVITNDYFMKYIDAHLTTATTTTQTVVIIFNGRL